MERFLRTVLAVALGAPIFGALAYASAAYAIAAPQPLTPANNTTLASDQFTALTWTSISDPSVPVQYLYEVSGTSTVSTTDGSFVSPIFRSGLIGTTSVQVSGITPGTYYWHVRAQNSAGDVSPWGAINALTVTSPVGTTTQAASSTGAISGTVFNDANGNRQLDTGEHGIANTPVLLFGMHMPPQRTMTDGNGNYSFSNLPAGMYLVLARLQRGDIPTVWPQVIRLNGTTSATNQNFGEQALSYADYGMMPGMQGVQGLRRF